MRTIAILVIASILLSCSKEEFHKLPPIEEKPAKTGFQFVSDIELEQISFILARQGSVIGEYNQEMNGSSSIELIEGYYSFANLKGLYQGSEIKLNNIRINGSIKSVIGRSVVFEVVKDEITIIKIIN